MKKLLFLLSIIFIGQFRAQVITTIAGGYVPNGAPASTLRVVSPRGLVIDSIGNIYFGDYIYSIILKVTPSGIVSTIAGIGCQGYSGDGGAATSAQLMGPQALAIDKSGNIYIADTYNNCIRKVSTSGVITTVAGTGIAGYGGDGGLATSALLNHPCGVATDDTGNVYIGDSDNQRIRKVNLSGQINTICGNGVAGFSGDGNLSSSAQLANPCGIMIYAGCIYIADAGNHRIRKINTSGIINTIAGNGFANYSGDGGLATLAGLNNPWAIHVDSSGILFIADLNNKVIRKINTSGIINTIIGNGTDGYGGDGGLGTLAQIHSPFGLCVDNSGNVFVADEGNSRIRKLDNTNIINTIVGNGSPAGVYIGDGGPGTSAEFFWPWGMDIDSIGNIYVADMDNFRIRKIDTMNIITTIAGNGSGGSGGDGASAVSAGLSYPHDVVLDRKGNIYISDRGNHKIRKVDSSGIITTVAGNGNFGFSGDGGPATLAKLYTPGGIAIDKKGNLYIGEVQNYRIRKVDTLGIITTIAGNGTPDTTGNGGLASLSTIGSPYDLAIDAEGNLYFADAYFDVIRKIDTSGIITTVAGSITGYSGDGGPATLAKLNLPSAITFDKIGNLFFSDANNHVIRMIDTMGIISTIIGSGTVGFSGDGGLALNAKLNYPRGIVINNTGNIYIADGSNNRIRKITKSYINALSEFLTKGDRCMIYPNPTSSIINIIIEQNELKNSTIEITNYLGQLVYTSPFITQIDLSSLSSGMYFLTVQDKSGKRTMKIIKE